MLEINESVFEIVIEQNIKILFIFRIKIIYLYEFIVCLVISFCLVVLNLVVLLVYLFFNQNFGIYDFWYWYSFKFVLVMLEEKLEFLSIWYGFFL